MTAEELIDSFRNHCKSVLSEEDFERLDIMYLVLDVETGEVCSQVATTDLLRLADAAAKFLLYMKQNPDLAHQGKDDPHRGEKTIDITDAIGVEMELLKDRLRSRGYDT